MSCGSSQEKKCQPKYKPLLPVALGNENRSHITPGPNLNPINTNCIQPGCMSEPKYNPCAPNDCPCTCESSQNPDPCCKSCYDYCTPTGHQRQCECEKCVCALQSEQDKECQQHVEGNRWRDLRKKSHDPEIQEIRDRLSSSDGIKSMLRWCPSDENLTCVVRRFRQAPFGYLGQAAIHYGAAQDKDFPKPLIHGVPSDILTPAKDLLNPPMKHWAEKLEEDVEESIYWSNRTMPIGKSHNQLRNLPEHVDPETTAFGDPTEKDISAAILVNPPKTIAQVKDEAEVGRGLYRITHGEFHPGEQICRNYEGNFDRFGTFGMHTPHDVAGRLAKKVMSTWRSCEPDPPFVSKTYADHLDLRLPKLGLPQDKNCIYRDRGDNFIYGKLSEPERERPIREIIFNRCPNPGAQKAELLMRNLKEWVTKVRASFKSARGADVEYLYEDFIAADKDCNGMIDWESFIKALKQQHVPRTMDTKNFMESLAMLKIYHPAACDKVDYNRIMDLLQGHEDPKFFCKTTTLKPYYLPHTNGSIHFRTTYSDLTANMCAPQCCAQRCKEQQIHGMPSVRIDKRPNKIRSTKDFTNYGDDGDAYSLIFPSVYTLDGITCRDAFREYTQEQMREIFARACVDISRQEFDCVWEAAKKLDPEGKNRVCFQTMREALCQVREECNPDEYEKERKIFSDFANNFCPPPPARKHRKPNPCAGVDP